MCCPLALAGQGLESLPAEECTLCVRGASCPGRILEKHPLHGLTHPLAALAAQEAANLRAEQAEPGWHGS